MKKILLTVVAIAALSGAALAGERERDSRLVDPNYGPATHVVIQPAGDVIVPFVTPITKSPESIAAEIRRLDSKNGYQG